MRGQGLQLGMALAGQKQRGDIPGRGNLFQHGLRALGRHQRLGLCRNRHRLQPFPAIAERGHQQRLTRGKALHQRGRRQASGLGGALKGCLLYTSRCV